jgi:hypothetical protein
VRQYGGIFSMAPDPLARACRDRATAPPAPTSCGERTWNTFSSPSFTSCYHALPLPRGGTAKTHTVGLAWGERHTSSG